MIRLVCNRYTGFLVAALIYSLLIDSLGGIRGGWKFICQYLEIPLLLYLYWYLNTIMRPGRWTAVLAAMPILLAYIGQDIYYLLMGKIFRIAELAEVAELMQVMALKYRIAVITAGAATLLFFLYCLDRRRISIVFLGILPLAAMAVWVEREPRQFTDSFRLISRGLVNWSDVRPVETNGRFAMLFFHEAERRFALGRTADYHDRSAYDEEARRKSAWLTDHGRRKNVHLIVMESLVDPTLFTKARYSASPIHPKYSALIGKSASLSISPIFGGKTSQAEFEALCGVPAYQELAGVEFSLFSGSPAHCLPGILDRAGYRTTASNAFNPSFFNAIDAYRGIGFQEMFFPREFSNDPNTYLSTGSTTGEIYMFDGVLFDQNLGFVADHLRRNPGKPLFNYVLTMYGHSPHVLNKQKRPQFIKLFADRYDRQLERVANQFFYRSEAIADYVEGLLAIDRESLIIIVADHLPPLEGITTYKKLGYLGNREDSLHLNRLIVIEEGVVTALPVVHHYDLPKVVFNYLSSGLYCRENSCGSITGATPEDRQLLHEEYLRVMAHAIQ